MTGRPLDGLVAMITGGAQGIGRAHALHLASLGASVVVNDLGTRPDGEGADRTAAETVVDEIVAAGGAAVADSSDVTDFEAAPGNGRAGGGLVRRPRHRDHQRRHPARSHAGLDDRVGLGRRRAGPPERHVRPGPPRRGALARAVESGHASARSSRHDVVGVGHLRQPGPIELRRGEGGDRRVHGDRGDGTRAVRRHRELSRTLRDDPTDRADRRGAWWIGRGTALGTRPAICGSGRRLAVHRRRRRSDGARCSTFADAPSRWPKDGASVRAPSSPTIRSISPRRCRPSSLLLGRTHRWTGPSRRDDRRCRVVPRRCRVVPGPTLASAHIRHVRVGSGLGLGLRVPGDRSRRRTGCVGRREGMAANAVRRRLRRTRRRGPSRERAARGAVRGAGPELLHHQPRHGGAGDRGARQRGGEATVREGAAPRGPHRVSAVQRAGCRVRSRLGDHTGGARRRRMGADR